MRNIFNPKPVEGDETFFEIPNFSRYCVNAKGRFKVKETGRLLEVSPNDRGYITTRFIDDSGKKVHVALHRLAAAAFYPETPNKESLQVNHKNGLPKDNSAENLEWCTAKENVRHSVDTGLKRTRSPLISYDPFTGEIEEFPLRSIAMETLGLSSGELLKRIGSDGQKIFPEGKLYKSGTSTTPWKKASNEALRLEMQNYGRSIPILVKDYCKGSIERYGSFREAARAIDLPESNITTRIKNNPFEVFAVKGNLYLLKMDDGTPWETVDDPVLNYEKSSGYSAIYCKNDETGEERIYIRLADAARSFEVGKTTMSYWINKCPGKTRKKGFKFYNYSDIYKEIKTDSVLLIQK